MVDDSNCIVGGCTDSESPGYDPYATYDDGSCPLLFRGCTHSNAANYRPIANVDDGSCRHVGCLDSAARNFDPTSNAPGACVDAIFGCTDSRASNFYHWASSTLAIGR